MSSPAAQFRTRVPRIASLVSDAAVERARLTVVPRARRTSAPQVPFVTLVTLLLVGGVVGLLLFNTSMQQASFAATELEQQAYNLSAREQTLQIELEGLRDPQRLAVRAAALGMVPGPSPAFLDLRTGKVVGRDVPASATNRLALRPPPAVKPGSLTPAPVKVTAPAPARDGDRPARSSSSGREDGSTREARDTLRPPRNGR